MKVEGKLISGEFDQQNKGFSLQTIKYFSTESTIKENQLTSLYNYLQKHKQDEGGQIFTLYDQMPVRLNQEEIGLLLDDFDQIRTLYKKGVN